MYGGVHIVLSILWPISKKKKEKVKKKKKGGGKKKKNIISGYSSTSRYSSRCQVPQRPSMIFQKVSKGTKGGRVGVGRWRVEDIDK